MSMAKGKNELSEAEEKKYEPALQEMNPLSNLFEDTELLEIIGSQVPHYNTFKQCLYIDIQDEVGWKYRDISTALLTMIQISLGIPDKQLLNTLFTYESASALGFWV